MTMLPEKVVPLLPFLIPAALMGYALIVTVGGTMLRKKRMRDEKARNAEDGREPWHRWLDEINRRVDEETKPGAKEKWRE